MDLCTKILLSQFPTIIVSSQIFAYRFFSLSSQQSQFKVPTIEPFVGIGADPRFNATTTQPQIPNY